MNSNNALFFSFDDTYAAYAKACIRSIRINYPHYPRILILYNGASRQTLRWFSRIDRSTLLNPTAYHIDAKTFPSGPVGSKTVYQRFILWSDRFAAFDNILYLDADTLVLAPLDELFEKDDFYCVTNHSPFSWVRIFSPEFKGDSNLRSQLKKDGLFYPDSADDMINSGVFMIPKIYRQNDHFERLLELTTDYGAYIGYEDQSIISLWLRINNLRPSNAFGNNFQVSFFSDPTVNVAPEAMKILHFCNYKPFTDDFTHWPLLSGRAHVLETLYRKYY